MSTVLRVALLGALTFAALCVPAAARAEITDAELTERVIDAIQRYPRFGMFDDISIAVENREVTLMGKVTQPIKKDEIGKRVAKIDGIRRLVNAIDVLPLSPHDDELRLTIARAIYNHPSFWQYASMAVPPIHIIVERGHVTLTGRVATQLDRTLANALAQVPGAFSVRNDLKLDSVRRGRL